MKCKRCGGKAVFHMKHHHLALCRADYLDWFVEQTARFIRKYEMFTPQDRILVAVSGGKDSLSLWDVLWRLGYAADGLYIDLGIDGGVSYAHQSRNFAAAFAAERNLRLHTVSASALLGQDIPHLAAQDRRGRHKPCSVCGISKRHIMNQVARDGSYTVLATGHNLDDEVAVLFGNTLEWKTDALSRQNPVLAERDGLARKVKPFCRFYERETAAYALLRGIAYVYDECPFAVGSKTLYYKDWLNKLEADRPGLKLTFYLDFLRARQSGAFPSPLLDGAAPLHPCPQCGQPTTTQGLCAFCRLAQNAG